MLAGLPEGLSHYFNDERPLVALLGGLMITSGVNMFKADHAGPELLGGDYEARRQLAALLFSGGWLIVALSTVYIHSKSSRGILEPLSAKTLLAFASAVAVVTGATMARAEYDADPLAEGISDTARMLFLGGWAGIALSMSVSTLLPFVPWSGTKITLSLIGVLTVLAGVMTTRSYELVDSKEYAEGDFSSALDRTRDWPKWLFGFGWVVIAAGIGYHR